MSLLDLPQIAEAQAAAYVTSNDADALLEKALCRGKVDHDASGGSFSMDVTDFKENFYHRISGTARAAFTVTVPASQRPFMVENGTRAEATIGTGSGAMVAIKSGECQLCYGDGSGVRGLVITATAPAVSLFSGALVTLSSDFSVSSTSLTPVNWASAEYDQGGYFAGSGNSELVVPAGVSKVVLRAQVRWNENSSNTRELLFYKNGSASYSGRAYVSEDAQDNLIQNITSPALAVTTGDSFQCVVWQNSKNDQKVLSGPSSWFSIEAVG
ncbi:hypothetical protein [Sneathiella glossodoripedis]|uniref:hypothetical protein n=1 Tax=Sneathiella glossodoripedis TaxID=418853 RepID=UPI00047082E4|nr:hypothetical protein [Sneathiella glossodoripedis]